LILYGLWQGGRGGVRHHDDRLLFLFWHAALLFGFYIMLSFFSVCYVNWAAPAYFTAFVLAVAVVGEGGWREKAKKRVLATALIVGIVSCSLLFTMDALKDLAVGLGFDVPAGKFPTSRLMGWHELGKEVSGILNDVGREKTFIISYKRDYVSELAFYVEGHPTVYTLNLSGRKESQYDLWEGFETKKGFNALYVTKLDRRPPDSFANAFDRVDEIKQVKIYAGKEVINSYSIFYCQGFRGMKQETP
jgi:hypothetical protein